MTARNFLSSGNHSLYTVFTDYQTGHPATETNFSSLFLNSFTDIDDHSG